MTDALTHQEVERYLEQMPHSVLDRLPDSEKRRVAKTHVDQAARLAHEALEGVEARPEPSPAPAFEVC